MKLIAICVIRNESDILEAFVRYHLSMFDRMIILNHRSVDSSAQILQSLIREGLSLEYRQENRNDFQQSFFMTRLMKEAVLDYGADWVLPLDADEFITADGAERVRDIIEKFPQDKIIKMPWRTYVPLPSDDFQEPDVLKRIQHYRRIENQGLLKIIIPRSLAMKKNGTIAMGNHGFVRQRFRKQKEFPYTHADQLVMAHFPVRSVQQLMVKVLAGWLACLVKPNKQPTEAFHIKPLYDRIKKGGQISPEELTAMAMGYATGEQFVIPTQKDLIHKPLIPEAGCFPLHYTDSRTISPFPVLAQLAEEFAEELGAMRRKERNAGVYGRLQFPQWLRLGRHERE